MGCAFQATDNFDPDLILCEGTFSTTFKGSIQQHPVVIKVFDQANETDQVDTVRMMHREAEALRGILHNHVVRIYGWCVVIQSVDMNKLCLFWGPFPGAHARMPCADAVLDLPRILCSLPLMQFLISVQNLRAESRLFDAQIRDDPSNAVVVWKVFNTCFHSACVYSLLFILHVCCFSMNNVTRHQVPEHGSVCWTKARLDTPTHNHFLETSSKCPQTSLISCIGIK